jgi:hypothetical protein
MTQSNLIAKRLMVGQSATLPKEQISAMLKVATSSLATSFIVLKLNLGAMQP